MGTIFSRSKPHHDDNRYGQEETDQKCHPCFFLGNGLSKVTRSSDPIGTPMPDTPAYRRRQREARGKNSIFSSKYDGLEKEIPSCSSLQEEEEEEYVASRTISMSRNSSNISDSSTAHYYEGPDCAQVLASKYQLLEVLGVGSTSTVHRCVCKKDSKEYACKIIDCQLIEERFQGMMQQFETEIEALRKLQHPGIIRLYDVYAGEDKIYIVMELMEGGELFDYVVQKGTLTEEEAAKIVRKVTSALVYMHEKNIVHRDLKPENLLLLRKPQGPNEEIDVKVIDFGLSKAMEEPVARTFLGTRGYLAPEMLQRRDYTRAVDTWALGVIVFVLLCGCLPFDDDSAIVPSDDLVRAKFVLRFPRWARNLSASAKNLLNHLLDVNPRTRFTAEQALNHPWVQGQTAPKGNLLASPGRIRQSPALNGSAKNNNGIRSKIYADRKNQAQLTSPAVSFKKATRTPSI